MSYLHALLLGLVEGITEYLPVSAAGHVIILGNLLGDPAGLVKSFSVALQAAPALAVLMLYWRRFDALLRPAHAGKTSFKGRHAWKLYSLAVLPVLLVGFLFKHAIYPLWLSPLPVVAGLAVGGLGILLAEARHQEAHATDMEGVTWMQALGVGLFQCLALWPGVSRSAATIVGGLLLGMNRKSAAEFSFLAGVPVFLAASALELLDLHALKANPHLLFTRDMFNLPFQENALAFVLALTVSFTVAALTVSLFMRWLAKTSFQPFGWYRLALSPFLWFFFR